MTRAQTSSRGFSLIELLITMVVLGVIVAITIPNLMGAIDRGKQKRTLADMRTIGTAIEAYAVDNSQYPVSTDTATLWVALTPMYLKPMTQSDGWDHTFVVNVGASEYTILSQGKDGVTSGCAVGVMTTQFTQDICFSHGKFIQYPEGVQH